MNKEKKKIISWIKEHKKELSIAGISTVSLVAIILGIKNRDLLQNEWINLKSIIDTNGTKSQIPNNTSYKITKPVSKVLIDGTDKNHICINNKTPFDVNRHLRNLPIGQNASPKKIAEANELNIVLPKGKTIVDAYRKFNNVA